MVLFMKDRMVVFRNSKKKCHGDHEFIWNLTKTRDFESNGSNSVEHESQWTGEEIEDCNMSLSLSFTRQISVPIDS